MAGKNYWYSSLKPPLDPEAAAEAKTIVDAFGARKDPIEIGGFPDDAEEDDELHGGGIAFMYAKGRILAREPYLAAMGLTRTSRNACVSPGRKEYWRSSARTGGSRKSRSRELSGTSCSST